MRSVPPEEVIVTVVVLAELLPPQPPERNSPTAASPTPTIVNAALNLTPTISPTVQRPTLFQLDLALFLRSKNSSPAELTPWTCCRALERPAHGEAERRLGFEIVQPPGIREQLAERRFDLKVPHVRRQRAWIESHLHAARTRHERVLVGRFANLERVDIRVLGDQLLIQPMDVVRVIDAERRLDDGQLHHELDAGRTAPAKVRSRSERQLLGEPGAERRRELGVREVLRQEQILKPGVGQFQGAAVQNTRCSRVKEKGGLNDVSNDGDAVFQVAVPLEVPARQGRGIDQGRYRKMSHATAAARIVIGDRRGGLFRNKRDRGNGANVVAADVALATHVEAAEGRNFLSAVARGVRRAEVQPDDIAVLVDRVEVLRIDYVGNGFDVAAEPRDAHGIEKALAAGGVNGVVDGVIRNGRGDGARDDAVQRVRAAQTGELQGLEKQRGCGVEGFDVRAG